MTRASRAVPAMVLLAAGTLAAALWFDHSGTTTLPAPTGPFPIGRVLDHWVDSAAVDPLALVPGTKRELVVWIWYPAAAGSSAKAADYLDPPLRTAVEHTRSPLINFLTRDLARVRTHSIENADVSPRAFPIVIMRAGASAGVWNYSALAEDLASHGYVVVGFDAPYRTTVVVLSDGRVVERAPQNDPELCASRPLPEQDACVSRVLNAWIGDIAFALDRLQQLNVMPGKFAGRLDISRIGVLGHSFGGATAAQYCHDDSRCKAAIDIDGQPFGSVVHDGLRIPFMFLLSDHARESDPVSRHIEANIQSIFDRLPPDRRLRVSIRGANHFFFSDDGALLKSHVVLGALRILRVIKIDGRRQLAITGRCVHTFFDAYLKGTSGPPPDLVLRLDPGIKSLQ